MITPKVVSCSVIPMTEFFVTYNAQGERTSTTRHKFRIDVKTYSGNRHETQYRFSDEEASKKVSTTLKKFIKGEALDIELFDKYIVIIFEAVKDKKDLTKIGELSNLAETLEQTKVLHILGK